MSCCAANKKYVLYSYKCCPSTYKIYITARYAGVEVHLDESFVSGETNKTDAFKTKFPFGKIPAMDAPEGPIYESNAICNYLVQSSKKPGAKDQLLGNNAYKSALISQWMCVAEDEFMPPARSWVAPLLGYMPYNAELVAKAKSDTLALLAILNNILLTRTFLVGEEVTLADICMSTVLFSVFKFVLDPETRRSFPNVTRWFLTCFAQPEFSCPSSCVSGSDFLCVTPITTPQPCTQKSSCNKTTCVAKASDAPAQKPAEKETSEKPKAKNELDLLPPSPFNLDAWKRFYSNNDTVPAAINYFWDNFDPAGYSMYRLAYKYPAELTLTFMSSNLIGGFFQRLESLRKYAFGSMCVFGEDNNNEISGMFIIRGSDIPQMFKEIPDFDSYQVEQVDPSDPAVRAEWQAYLAWEGDFKKPFVAGKIFK